MDESNLISAKIKSIEPERPLVPKQSANCLFRFFTKAEYLLKSIERKALSPRYYVENVDYLGVGLNQIAYPMICFCDIAMHNLEEHANFYGSYGIAFSKSWGIEHGIQPIQYINENSILRKDFSEAFKAGGSNYLLTHMYYLKPITGSMERNGKNEKRLFTDECEWRYVPDVKLINFPQAVLKDDLACLTTLNDTLEDTEKCWLKFDLSDIKYIIVDSEEEIDLFCDQIEKVSSDPNLNRKLFAKITVWKNAKEDF